MTTEQARDDPLPEDFDVDTSTQRTCGLGQGLRPCPISTPAPTPETAFSGQQNPAAAATTGVSQNLTNGSMQVALSPTPGVEVGDSTESTTMAIATYTAGPEGVQPSVVPGVATSSSSKGGNGLSNGAIAGVAIGALIVGAGLAFLAAFFLFKRRNKSRANDVSRAPMSYTHPHEHEHDHNYNDSSPELLMMQKSVGRNSPYVQVSQSPMTLPMPTSSPPPDIITSILPTPAQETAIQDRVVKLFSMVHRHVETYYRDVHASITASMEPDLMRFGAKDVNMAELLQDCSSPTTAIKHALVAYVLGITGPGGDAGLWPENLGRVGEVEGDDATVTTALTIHRRLSVFLHSTQSPSSKLHSAMREAAEHFSLTFFPWANPGSDDQEKDDELVHIISEALETRIWLYGQPAEYVFRWDGVGTRGVVVRPELVRVEGEGNGRGRVLVESGVAGL